MQVLLFLLRFLLFSINKYFKWQLKISNHHVSHVLLPWRDYKKSSLISEAGSVWDIHFLPAHGFGWWTLRIILTINPLLFTSLLLISFLPSSWLSDFFIREQTSKWGKVDFSPLPHPGLYPFQIFFTKFRISHTQHC